MTWPARILVRIKSYERPRALLNLLRDIDRCAVSNYSVEVWVFDDRSSAPMDEPKRYVDERSSRHWQWRTCPEHFGKERAWEFQNGIFHSVNTSWSTSPRVAGVFFFDDDMRLCDDFFERALAIWERIEDPRKATLHFMRDSSREHSSCWTGVKPATVNEEVRRTQWVDGSFMTHREALQAINWKIEEIDSSRWAGKGGEILSTGVGQQMSVRWHALGWNMYQTSASLLVHADHASQYNPQVRKRTPLETVHFIDGEVARRRLMLPERVEGSLASIPERERALEQVVAALLPQVDVLRVYLNGYAAVPSFLDHPRVVVARSQDHGDRGDAGKFFWADRADGYQIICDDDLLYPRDYVTRMVGALERFGRRAAVGVHAVTLHEPFEEYYRDRTVVHFSLRLQRDAPQHVLGTGCLAYHPETIAVRPEDFRAPNMADIWFGLLAQEQEVPLMAVARNFEWVRAIPDVGEGIYDRREEMAPKIAAAIKTRGQWVHHLPSPPRHHRRCGRHGDATGCRCQSWPAKERR